MINPVRRREWLRSLRQFKISVRIWKKLGLLDAIIAQVVAERRQKIYHRPAWHLPEWQNLLYDCISTGKPTTELMRGFAQSSNQGVFRHLEINPDLVLSAMEKVLKQYSYEMRVRHGVFTGEK